MSTRLRRTILLFLASACLVPPLVCVGLLYLRQPREGLKGRLYQVRNGTTRAEVEAIMGRPPDQVWTAAMPVASTGPTDVGLSWEETGYYQAEVILDGREERVRLRRIFCFNHQQTLVDRWAPSWMDRTSPPAFLDEWWPQR
jgi:hypothetical protein